MSIKILPVCTKKIKENDIDIPIDFEKKDFPKSSISSVPNRYMPPAIVYDRSYMYTPDGAISVPESSNEVRNKIVTINNDCISEILSLCDENNKSHACTHVEEIFSNNYSIICSKFESAIINLYQVFIRQVADYIGNSYGVIYNETSKSVHHPRVYGILYNIFDRENYELKSYSVEFIDAISVALVNDYGSMIYNAINMFLNYYFGAVAYTDNIEDYEKKVQTTFDVVNRYFSLMMAGFAYEAGCFANSMSQFIDNIIIFNDSNIVNNDIKKLIKGNVYYENY